MKKLTIKIDKGLTKFAVAAGESIPSAIKMIEEAIDKYAPKEIDHECNAGDSLSDVLYQSEADLKAMVRMIPIEAWKHIGELTLWGVSGDCPHCGCVMDLWDYDEEDNAPIFKCTNCGKRETR